MFTPALSDLFVGFGTKVNQSLICNSCGAQGHKANDCPDRDKCRRCVQSGYLACHCTNVWDTRPADTQDPSSAGPSNGADPGDGADSNAIQGPQAQGASASEPGLNLGSSLLLVMLIKIVQPKVSRLLNLI